MITFDRTQDVRLVRAVLTDPRCWRRMANDWAPPREEFDPAVRSDLDYIIARDDDGVPVALFVLLHRSGYSEIHFCFRPHAWGRTLDIARALLDWLWRETVLTWIIGPVPGYNRLALRLAKAAGFTEFCREKDAVQKYDHMYDRILMSITRPDSTYRREAGDPSNDETANS